MGGQGLNDLGYRRLTDRLAQIFRKLQPYHATGISQSRNHSSD